LVEIEGLDTLNAFGDFSDDLIEHMARKYERPGPDQMHFGICRIIKMKAIAFWVRKQCREGVEATVNQLNEVVICTMMQEMMKVQMNRRKTKSVLPGKV
jgi:hypothetical protein